MMATKPKFTTTKVSPLIQGEQGKNIVLNHTTIENYDGDKKVSSSEHLVIKYFRTSPDGTTNGIPKQIFLPLSMKDDLRELLNSFD